jgi:heptosyltransferase-2
VHTLFKAIDRWAGSLLILLLSPFSRSGKPEGSEPSSILVVRLWTLGETLLVTPLIGEIRRRYPGAEITVLCREANCAVFGMIPGADRVLLFETGTLFSLVRDFRRYDMSFDTEPWFRVSALLSFWLAKRRIGFSHGLRKLLYTDLAPFDDRQYEAQTFLDLLRPLGISARFAGFPPVEIPEAEARKVEDLMRSDRISGMGPRIAMCPGAEDALYRMWPAARFAAAADGLIERYGADILLIGSAGEAALCAHVMSLARNRERIANLAGRTTLHGLFHLVKGLDLLITNDTGPMHVAAVVGTRTVSLFGPNLPVRFAPRTLGSISLFHGDEGNPIINVHEGKIPARARKEHFEPIGRITVDEVLEAAEQTLRWKPEDERGEHRTW